MKNNVGNPGPCLRRDKNVVHIFFFFLENPLAYHRMVVGFTTTSAISAYHH
jgi:hypothetical protein